MKKLIFLFCITFGLAQNNGIRSLNGSLNNSQRLTIDTTSSATFRWGLSNGVHTLYLPHRIVNPSSGSSFTWRKSGSSAVTDSIRFIQGSGVSLTQTGNTLTISASGGGSVGNADSLGNLPASDWFLRSDTVGLKSRLLKNADSTIMRNYSNALYSVKSGSSSIVTVGTITSGTWNGTAIDTAYSNSVAHITSKTGLLTATRYNTKDFQLDFDTTGATGLRSKYVPYSGANASVNLGAQTLTTTGAGSFGAISGTTVTGTGLSTASSYLATQYSTTPPFESRSTSSATRWRWGIFATDSSWVLEKVGLTYPIKVFPATGRVRFIDDIDVDGGQIRSTADLEIVPAGGDFGVTATRSSISGTLTVGSTSSANVMIQYGQAPYFAQKNNTETEGGIVLQDEQDTTQRAFFTYNAGTNLATLGNSTANNIILDGSGNVLVGSTSGTIYGTGTNDLGQYNNYFDSTFVTHLTVTNTISSGAITSSGLSSFGTNAGSATIGAGDSVQVTVTGLTTATGVATVAYKRTGATSVVIADTIASYNITTADKITLYGKYGWTVSYVIGKK